MRIKILFLLFLIVGFTVGTQAQTLFLPQSLNTTKSDRPVDFAEYQGAYYFVGTQWPTQAGGASSGFCYKTDSAGNVLKTFHLNGLDSNRCYSFEAVYGYNDQIYVVATVGDFRNESYLLPPRQGEFYDGYSYNKILVLRFNLNLNLNRADTLQYDTDSSDIQTIKSVGVGSRIFMSYGTTKLGETIWGTRGYLAPAFLTAYNTNTSLFTHQPFDSAYMASYPALNGMRLGNDNYPTSLTPTGDGQMLIGGSFTIGSSWHTYLNTFQIDTNLSITYMPFAAGYSFQSRGMSFISEPAYEELWKPTASSSYFAGPVFFQDTSNNGGCQGYRFNGVGRLDATTQTIAVGTQVRQLFPQQENYWQSSKNPMTLLNNKTHFIISGQATLWDSSWRLDTSYIWVSKFDTSLNLIWTRNFEKPSHYFDAAGVHELQNGKLMMIASAVDTNVGNIQDLYCFIIDSNGTPLNTFSIATKNAVKLYPNPAQNEIRFSLPDGQAMAAYRILDLTGKVLLEGSYFSGNAISVDMLPSGNYLFQVQSTADKVWHSGLFTKN